MSATTLPAATAQRLYSRQPGFDEAAVRRLFQSVTDVRTLVVCCLDPRASGVPAAVAREFGESWPGDVVRDEAGNKVAFTTNVGVLTTAGGRAVDVVRSVTLLKHLLNYRRVVVVHHTFCGMTAMTADGVIAAHRHEHGEDLSTIHAREHLAIDDLERSVRHDVALLRKAPGVSKQLELFGYVYDIDSEELIKVIEDRPTEAA
ncbi:MAG: hypothetical protein JOY66_12000 [Acetobacteraceae bacterium]|nr:hypothetical protein [Acetobacteraceae bacterium]